LAVADYPVLAREDIREIYGRYRGDIRKI